MDRADRCRVERFSVFFCNAVCAGDVLLDGLQPLRHMGQHGVLLRVHAHLLLGAVHLLVHGNSDRADGDVNVLADDAAVRRPDSASGRVRQALLLRDGADTRRQGQFVSRTIEQRKKTPKK